MRILIDANGMSYKSNTSHYFSSIYLKYTSQHAAINSMLASFLFARLGLSVISLMEEYYREPNCQKATALAAATFNESTPWDMGILTV